MMRLTKRVFSAFLAFVMVFTMLPLDAWAADGTSDNSLVAPLAVPSGPEAVGLELDQSSAVIQIGGTATFVPKVTMNDGTTQEDIECTWVSDHPEVAKVADGVVTGVAEGTAKITCTYGELETFAMVTVTKATFTVLYKSNYQDGAKKYIYTYVEENGRGKFTSVIETPNNTTYNETYSPGAEVTVAENIFTTINYRLTGYKDEETGEFYTPGWNLGPIKQNYTLVAQWEPIPEASTTDQTIQVVYHKTNNDHQGNPKYVSATVQNISGNTAQVTFLTANIQDALGGVNQTNIRGWTIDGSHYEFNQQVTVEATKGNGDRYWRVDVYPWTDSTGDDTAPAQFYVRKSETINESGSDAKFYYSVGGGTIKIEDDWKSVDFGDPNPVAGSDDRTTDVRDYIVKAPSAAQIANLMNLELDEAASVRWYVIKKSDNGYHVDGYVYSPGKYWKVEFVDPDSDRVVQTLLIEDQETLTDAMQGDTLDTKLRTFKHWSYTKDGPEVDLDTIDTVSKDIKLYAVFDRNSGYTVEYYLEDNGRYVLKDTVEEYAEDGAFVEADQKTYTGYKLNTDAENTKLSGKVTADGKLTLRLYYDQLLYSVKAYIYAGNSGGSGNTVLLDTRTRTNLSWEELQNLYSINEHYKIANEFWDGNIFGNGDMYQHRWDPKNGPDAGKTQDDGFHEVHIYLKEDSSTLIDIQYYENITSNEDPWKTAQDLKGNSYTIEVGPTRDGYEFTGWNTKEDGSGTWYTAGREITLESDLTLYAQWEQKIFTGRPITVEVVKDGERVDARGIISLAEWPDMTLNIGFIEDETYTVTFDYMEFDAADFLMEVDIPQGYRVASVTSDKTTTQSNQDDDTITFSATDTSSSAGTSWSLDNVPGGAKITVTLKKLEYTVTYQPGEHGALTGADAYGNVVYLNVAYGEKTPNAPEVNAEKGYYFTGWSPEIEETVTGNAVYTAQYAPQTAIIVKAKDLTKPYDGDALAADNTYELIGDLEEGHKLVVTTKVSEDVTNVTDEGGKHQIASVKVLDSNGDNVTYLYDITMLEGDLTITPITITLTSESKSWYYDGQPHSWPEVKIDGKFVEGEGFVTDADGKPLFTNFATVQIEGESKKNTFNYTLDSETTNGDNYDIQVTYGTISISNSYDVTYVFRGDPAPEGVNAPEGEKYLEPNESHTVAKRPDVPNGYTFDGWYVGETKYEPGQTITIENQDITLVGNWTKLYKVTYEGNAPEGTTVDINGEAYQPAYYDDGKTVTLAPAPTAPDGYTFDGWEIVGGVATITGGTFTMPDMDVTIQATWAKRSDLSYTVNHYLVGTTLKVKDSETVNNQVFGDNVQVTAGEVPDGYELQSAATQSVTIGVNKNEVNFYYYKLATVTADNKEMTYGGTFPALTAAVTGLYGSDEATKITYNTPTTTATFTSPVGNYPIEVAGNEIQDYYKVTYVPGELIIKPATMNLTVEGYDEVYDGKEHGGNVSGYPDGAELLYSKDGGGSWSMEAPTVTDYTENPVTVKVKVTLANYNEVIKEYTLNVQKRPVTLVSEGATRPYNGQALTNANWHYEGKYKFVNDEVTKISTIGTQTEIGSSKNTIAYEKTAKFDEGNYIIELVEGELVVTPPQNPNDYAVVTKTHDKDELNPGDPVTFIITVKNIFADTATVTLEELPGVNFSVNGKNVLNFSVNGGGTEEVEATYTITETDVLAGKFVNEVSATLVVGDQTVEASATDTVALKAAPALTVEKTVTSTPRNNETYALGETITWEIEVTNSGNVGLKNVSLRDTLKNNTNAFVDNLDLGEEANAFDLAAGSSKTFTVSYEVKESDLGKNLVNTATASAENPADPDGEPVQDEKRADPIPTDDLEPNLSVTKEADRTSAKVGDTINYTIKVTNTGNQTLNSIQVTDPLTGLKQTIAKLEPDETSEAIPTSYVVKASDLIAGKVTNIATAKADNGTTASGTAKVDVTGKLDISVNLASGKFPYDGEPHTVSGIAGVTYTLDGGTPVYVEGASFTVGGTTFTLSCAENTATATGTNVVRNPDGTVGSYPVTANVSDITVMMDDQDVTGKVTVTNVTPGSLKINPRKVTITVQDAEKTYGESDPTPFQAVLSGDRLVNDTDLGTITCSRTNEDEDADVYEGVLTASYTPNDNYDVTVVKGKFTIMKYTLPVVVTIEGTSAEKPYTGSKQSVEGYTITSITVNGVKIDTNYDGVVYPEESVLFVGDASDKEASGTYVGEYPMALNKDDFANGNANFTKVTFQVTPGKLTITPGTYKPVTKTHEEKQDGSEFALNETVTFPITVVNIYNTPAKVTLKEMDGVFFEGGSQTAEWVLTPGQKMIFIAYYVITEQDILNESFTNTVEWTIAPTDGTDEMSGTATDTVKVVKKAPQLKVTKSITSTDVNKDNIYGLNETITYSIVVENTGNVTAKNITVQDVLEIGGVKNEPVTLTSVTEGFNGELKPGETAEFTYQHKVTQEDLGKTIVNTATATAEDPDGENVPSTPGVVTTTTEQRNPHLKVVKSVVNTGTGANGAFKLDETIQYKVVLTNDGNVTLNYVTIRDYFGATEDTSTFAGTDITSSLVGGSEFDGTLEPDESVEFTYSYTVKESDLGKTIVNQVTDLNALDETNTPAGTNDDEGTVMSETDAPNPDLKVKKTVLNKEKAPFDLDETIHYQITVSNTGNVTLTNVSVEDVLKDSLGNTIETLDLTGAKNFSLAPKGHEGDSKTFNVSYTVKEEDLGKTLKNTATAASKQTQPDPDDPDNDDHDETDGEQTEKPSPNMSVTKEVVKKQTSYRVGDVITYQITVTNTGNTTIHNVELMDHMNANGKVTFKNLGGGQMVGGSPVLAALAPKTAWVVTCQYTVQLADADSDGTTISNKVTVNAEDGPDGKDPETQTPGEDIDPIYTLTIKYQNGARVDLRDPDTVKLHAGDVYTVVAPGINGYHLSDKADAKFDFTMRDRDTTIVIIYAANPVEDEEDDPVVNPDNDPDETTEETTEETVDEVDPGVYIEDPDDYTLTPITEEEPPLADLDVGDHTCCIMHFLLMLAAMVVLGFYTDSKKKHQARIFELKRTLAMEKGKNPDEDNSQQS